MNRNSERVQVGPAALIVAIGAALDLATKAWARASLEPYGPAFDFLPFVSLHLTFNEGVSFGLFAFEGDTGQAALVKIRQLEREGGSLSQDAIDAIRSPVIAEYRRTASAWHATSELWDDGIIDPLDTRVAIALALSAALNPPIAEPHYGVFRM